MKKLIFALALAVCFVSNILASGVIPINTSQSGIVTYTATNSVTTAFTAPFSVPPAMTLLGSVTNLLPFANTVTTTNFTLAIAATNATGAGWGSVAWSAYPAFSRIQYGAAVASLAVSTNITVTFTTPYSYAPNVVHSAENMVINTNQLSMISAITTTGFTISCVGPMTNLWQAIGPCATPGPSTITY